jgi:hypothetical protein
MKDLTNEQRFEVVRYFDRIFYAAINEGFSVSQAQEVAGAAKVKKVKELKRANQEVR